MRIGTGKRQLPRYDTLNYRSLADFRVVIDVDERFGDFSQFESCAACSKVSQLAHVDEMASTNSCTRKNSTRDGQRNLKRVWQAPIAETAGKHGPSAR